MRVTYDAPIGQKERVAQSGCNKFMTWYHNPRLKSVKAHQSKPSLNPLSRIPWLRLQRRRRNAGVARCVTLSAFQTGLTSWWERLRYRRPLLSISLCLLKSRFTLSLLEQSQSCRTMVISLGSASLQFLLKHSKSSFLEVSWYHEATLVTRNCHQALMSQPALRKGHSHSLPVVVSQLRLSEISQSSKLTLVTTIRRCRALLSLKPFPSRERVFSLRELVLTQPRSAMNIEMIDPRLMHERGMSLSSNCT
jgi:hypothetical protein